MYVAIYYKRWGFVHVFFTSSLQANLDVAWCTRDVDVARTMCHDLDRQGPILSHCLDLSWCWPYCQEGVFMIKRGWWWEQTWESFSPRVLLANLEVIFQWLHALFWWLERSALPVAGFQMDLFTKVEELSLWWLAGKSWMHLCYQLISITHITLPETISSHLKMDGFQ